MRKSAILEEMEKTGQARDILYQWYVTEHLSTIQIGKKVGLTSVAVNNLLRKYNIVLRKGGPRLGGRKSPLHHLPIEDWARLDIAGIARKYGIDYVTVYNFYHRYKEVIDEGCRSFRRRSRNR